MAHGTVSQIECWMYAEFMFLCSVDFSFVLFGLLSRQSLIHKSFVVHKVQSMYKLQFTKYKWHYRINIHERYEVLIHTCSCTEIFYSLFSWHPRKLSAEPGLETRASQKQIWQVNLKQDQNQNQSQKNKTNERKNQVRKCTQYESRVSNAVWERERRKERQEIKKVRWVKCKVRTQRQKPCIPI